MPPRSPLGRFLPTGRPPPEEPDRNSGRGASESEPHRRPQQPGARAAHFFDLGGPSHYSGNYLIGFEHCARPSALSLDLMPSASPRERVSTRASPRCEPPGEDPKAHSSSSHSSSSHSLLSSSSSSPSSAARRRARMAVTLTPPSVNGCSLFLGDSETITWA